MCDHCPPETDCAHDRETDEWVDLRPVFREPTPPPMSRDGGEPKERP